MYQFFFALIIFYSAGIEQPKIKIIFIKNGSNISYSLILKHLIYNNQKKMFGTNFSRWWAKSFDDLYF